MVSGPAPLGWGGGGSVMDTAKAINILATEGGEDIRPYAGVNNLKRPLKPFLAVPTTAGNPISRAMIVA